MALIAELELTHSRMALAEATAAVPGAIAKAVYHTAVRPDVDYLFYAVSGCDFDDFEDALAADPTVSNPTMVEDTADEERVYRIEPTAETLLLMPKAAELGCINLAASVSGGVWTVRLRFPDRESLMAFKSHCEGLGIGFSVAQLYSPHDGAPADEFGLTDAQREALETAFRMGYFEEPRRASLEELAEELGISSSAAGGRLRRATARLVSATLSPDDTTT